MIRYGDESWNELRFAGYRFKAEKRDAQWIDVYVRVATDESTPLPEDLTDFEIMAVCTYEGHPIQLVTLDEGCDCEYQLTAGEQEQIHAFIRSGDVQRAIREAAAKVEA